MITTGTSSAVYPVVPCLNCGQLTLCDTPLCDRLMPDGEMCWAVLHGWCCGDMVLETDGRVETGTHGNTIEVEQ